MITFEQVLQHFGGTHESLADALGISREAVTMWRGRIPEQRAYQIEVLSKGKLRAAELPTRRRNRAA